MLVTTNGGELCRLSDPKPLDATQRPHEALATLAAEMRAHQFLVGSSKIHIRPLQLTVTATDRADSDDLWTILEELLHQHAKPGVSAVRSGHSIDVLAPGVDKRAIVKEVATNNHCNGMVLCVGDRGAYPGNDHLLLSEPCALSVDEVSEDPETCWNLAPLGTRWVDACLEYLRRLAVSQGEARFG